MIKEVFFLRTLACLSIVLGHSIASSLNWFPFLEAESRLILSVWRTVIELLLFGTPVFVFISALVLSHAYPQGTPKGFLLKRTKYILIPYAVMGVCYAVLACAIEGSFRTLPAKVLQNVLLGQYHGYFILIIFQFYLLHMVFHKLLKTIPLKHLMVYALLINVAYLAVAGIYWNHSGLAVQIWWLPLFAWIFYYVLAFHIGRNLDWYRIKLKPYGVYLLIGCVAAGAMVPVLSGTGVFPSGSKRVDVLVYTVLVCFLVYRLASKTVKVPRWVEAVSSYSFGIYWLHVFFIAVLHKVFKLLPEGVQEQFNVSLYIVYLFVSAALLSMASTYLVTRVPGGAYIVGKLGPGVRGKAPQGTKQEQALNLAK